MEIKLHMAVSLSHSIVASDVESNERREERL